MRHLCKWLALAICGILAVLTILLVLPGLFGIHPLIVQSGSMEPVYPKGSMVYIRSVDPYRLSEGNIVTYRLEDGKTLVTHRIMRMDMDRKEIYTKETPMNWKTVRRRLLNRWKGFRFSVFRIWVTLRAICPVWRERQELSCWW